MIIFTKTQLAQQSFPKDDLAQAKAVNVLTDAYAWIYGLDIGLKAVVVIGSTTGGDATIASDLDVLAFWDDTIPSFWDQMAKAYPYLGPALTQIRDEFRVHVEAHPILLSQVSDPTNQRDDQQFLRHAMKACEQGGLIAGKREAVELFYKTAPQITLGTTLSYIDTKVRKVNKGQSCWGGLDEPGIAQLYSNAVNSPFHALRRAFTLRGVEYEDSRTGIIRTLWKQGASLTHLQMLTLYNLGQEYVRYLEFKRENLPSGCDPFERTGLLQVCGSFRGAMEGARSLALTGKIP